MKISRIFKEIKCDTVMCNKNADFELESKSYKGSIYLCENCFNAMSKLFKRIAKRDE